MKQEYEIFIQIKGIGFTAVSKKGPALEQERPKWEERDRPSADGR